MDVINYIDKVKKIKINLNSDMWTISEDRPQIEKDLTEIQRKYFKEEDPQKKKVFWQEMFLLVQRYGRSLVLKKCKGGRYVSPDQVEDDSIQVALSFMSQYLYRPGFHVGVSFAGMMNPKVMEALYKQVLDDQNWSLNETIGDSDNEFEEIQKTEGMVSIFREIPLPDEEFLRKISITKILNDLFEEFDNSVEDELVKLKLRFYIFIFLKKPRNKHIYPTFFKYQCNKKELDLIQLFELELYNRLKDFSN